MLDILQQHFQLSVVWDEGWQPTGQPLRAEQINELNPDLVLFWQTIPPLHELRRIRCRRLFIAPMYDHVMGNPQDIWPRARASGLRVISFSRATHDYFVKLGYESRLIQYWQEPMVRQIETDSRVRIFFWPRRHEIGWTILKALLGSSRPERIVIRIAPDPDQAIDMPTEAEIAEYKVDIVRGWMGKPDYLQLLSACNVFIAPRLREGIGLSFIEAMTYGMAVVAPDAPTMNEYIEHGRNGYLYDSDAPKPIDFSNLHSVRLQLLADVAQGYKSWQSQQANIYAYLASEARTAASLSWRLRKLFQR